MVKAQQIPCRHSNRRNRGFLHSPSATTASGATVYQQMLLPWQHRSRPEGGAEMLQTAFRPASQPAFALPRFVARVLRCKGFIHQLSAVANRASVKSAEIGLQQEDRTLNRSLHAQIATHRRRSGCGIDYHQLQFAATS
jgi:hypothetical protein